jgi:hypothetical protein
MRSSAAALALAAALAVPAVAAADVRPLAERASLGVPALDGGRVVYADADRDALSVLTQPADGGPVTELARLAEPSTRLRGRPAWDLDAGAGGLAVRLYPPGGRPRLLAGPPEGPLSLVQRRADLGAAMAEARDLFAVPGGPLVLERIDRVGRRLRAVLRPPGGPARVLPMPAGADLHNLAVAGSVAAVAARDEIELLDLPSGAVRERRPLGDFARTDLIDLAVSETGDLAFTVEAGDGADFLGWLPAGAAEPRVVAEGDEFGHVRTAGGRIAMEAPVMRGDGARVVVLDPSGEEARVLFRGPPSAYVRGLDFDGQRVAWATDGCQLVASVDSPAIDVVPAGPCLRTEAAFTLHVPSAVRVGVRCITAPGRRCRIDLRVYGRTRRLAHRVVTVPRGRVRTVRIPVRSGLAVVMGRVVDPDGRRRLAVIL